MFEKLFEKRMHVLQIGAHPARIKSFVNDGLAGASGLEREMAGNHHIRH
jgi:hypothetical protein